MAEPNVITIPAGEEMVIISRKVYEQLLEIAADAEEDAADIAMYDLRKAELSSGREKPLPAEVSANMMRGDRLLKALRKWRGMTQAELAEKAEIQQGFCSEIEAGSKRGSEETMARLAKALDVPLNWLV